MKNLFLLLFVYQVAPAQIYNATYNMYGKQLSKKRYIATLDFDDTHAIYNYKSANAVIQDSFNPDSDIESGYKTYIIYTDKAQNKIFEKVGTDYTIEPINKTKWVLSEETKQIGDFKCIKAVKEFRGRTYTAWYTMELKTSFGPWKLHGLPGLIIEAYDDSKKVRFKLVSLDHSKLKEKELKIGAREFTIGIAEHIKSVHDSNIKKQTELAKKGINFKYLSIEKNYFDIQEGLKSW